MNFMKSLPYYDDLTARQTIKLRELIKTLPPFAKEFFRAIDSTTQVRTRIAYAYDLRVFFHFLIDENPAYRNYSVLDFKVSDLDKIESVDLEEYMEYLKVYISEEQHKHMQNTEQGVFRKMSALRSFYGYFYKRQLIEKNPTLLVDMPKIREKEIIRLEADEVASLLDFVEHGGDHLTGQKLAYYEKTKERDLAIITLLLGTGIRVSELVGLNVDDVDFRNNGLHLIRKGRKEMTVYFGNEVADALEQYIEGSRKLIIPKEGHEDVLKVRHEKDKIIMTSLKESFRDWEAYRFIEKTDTSSHGYTCEMLSNSRKSSFFQNYRERQESSLGSRTELFWMVQSFEHNVYVELEKCEVLETPPESCLEGDMNPFLGNTVFPMETRKTLALYFTRKGQKKNFCEDMVRFFVSQIQLSVCEYKCVGILQDKGV